MTNIFGNALRRCMRAMGGYFTDVPDRLRKRRWFIWAAFVAATAFFIAGMGRANFDASIEGWFEKDDPTIVALDWFHHEFGSDDHLFIVYKPRDGDVFSEASLKTLKAMHEELTGRIAALREGDTSPLSRIVKVTSLINAPVLAADGGVLISRKLVGGEVPATQAERDKLVRVAHSQRPFPQLYFSKDRQYGGILVETNFGAIPVGAQATKADLNVSDIQFDAPEAGAAPMERPKFKPTDMADYLALMNEVRGILTKPEYAGHFEYYAVGNTASAEHNLAMVKEMGLLNLAALLIMIALLWVFFRSLSAVVWPLVIVLLSVTWMVGITAWLGLPITSFVMIAVMLTLTVGVADTVHVMASYVSARNGGESHATALRSAMGHVAVACLLTTITNVVAVMALSITPVVPIKVFALMCSLGVALPFVFSVYLLPLMLDLWAPKKAQPARRGLGAFASRLFPDLAAFTSRRLDKVLPWVEKRPVAIICAFMALFALCIYGATKTRVDTDPIASFPKDSTIVRDVHVVDANMMGSQSMEIFLDLGQVNAFHDPYVLQVVDELQRTLEKNYGRLVVRTTSLADTVKHSYETLNEGKAQMYVIPQTREAVSQTLFLFNQSNPDDRRKLVSDNYDKSHISVRLLNAGSFEYAKTWDGMRADIDHAVKRLQEKYPQAKVSITGVLALMMQGADYLTTSELQSFALALVLVSLLLLVLFGSFKAGAIALIPNLIPAILGYGALGLLDKPLDITTMMIAPIIIGIAIDDTVHFVMRYRNEVSIHGDIRQALQTTLADTGLSVVFTTLILGMGFGIMSLASNAGAANLGIFGAMAIFVGLLNDLFLLPAMILVFKPKLSGQASPAPAAA